MEVRERESEKENLRREIGRQSYISLYEKSKMNLGEGNPRRKKEFGEKYGKISEKPIEQNE